MRGVFALPFLLAALATACSESSTPDAAGTPAPGADAAGHAGSDGAAGSAGDDAADLPASDAAANATAAPDGGVAADTGAPAGALSLVHFLGRFDTGDAAGPRFAWPGSAIATTFQGTGLAVQLTDSGTNYFAYTIDGGAPKSLATTGSKKTYTLASGLPAGTHSVVLTKRTETYVGTVQFLGFTPTGGALVPSPEPFSRRIEIIGDSISCGYGVLGANEMCHFTPQTEDETVAYGALTAAQLGAQQTVIAYSGIGMYRNNDNSTTNTMPQRYGRTLGDDASSVWGFTTPPPDAVVLSLGTNDFAKGDPGSAFQTTYVAFLKTVRQKYPNARIFCMASPMMGGNDRATAIGYIKNAVQAVGDAKIAMVPVSGSTTAYVFEQQASGDGLGCDYHPSVATQKKMAAALAPAMKSALGW